MVTELTSIHSEQERRRQDRACPEDLIGLGLFLPGEDREHVAVVDNLSVNGIGITTNLCLSPGSAVEIDPGAHTGGGWDVLGNGKFRGQVCWCVREEDVRSVYHLGIRREARAS